MERDAGSVDALLVDRYLDALLAAHERRAADAPADAALDPAVRDIARRLHRDLVRFHPSFRFEERLAARLAALAAGRSDPAGADAVLVEIAAGRLDPAAPDPADLGPTLGRPLLLRGAMASAALSVAGAVYVAWRARRAPAPPMVRAARAARRGRLAVGPLARRSLA